MPARRWESSIASNKRASVRKNQPGTWVCPSSAYPRLSIPRERTNSAITTCRGGFARPLTGGDGRSNASGDPRRRAGRARRRRRGANRRARQSRIARSASPRNVPRTQAPRPASTDPSSNAMAPNAASPNQYGMGHASGAPSQARFGLVRFGVARHVGIRRGVGQEHRRRPSQTAERARGWPRSSRRRSWRPSRWLSVSGPRARPRLCRRCCRRWGVRRAASRRRSTTPGSMGSLEKLRTMARRRMVSCSSMSRSLPGPGFVTGNVDPAGSVYTFDAGRTVGRATGGSIRAHAQRPVEPGQGVHPRGGPVRRAGPVGGRRRHVPRCPGARRVRAGRHPQRGAPAPGPPRVPGGGQAPRQVRPRRRLLRRGRPLGLRRQDHGRPGLHRRAVAGRRVQPLEGRRPSLGGARDPDPGAAQPLPAPPPPARGGRGRPAEAARVQGAAARRRRPRLPGRPLPGGSRGRHPRHHRHGRRRRVEPAAPDPAQHGPGGRPQGRLGEEDADRAQPRRERRHLRRAAGRRQHPRHHRRLRRHRGRDRQLPDPLPRERRLAAQADPGDPRLHLPFRGPGHRVRSLQRSLLPLPDPRAASRRAGAVVLGGRRAGRAAGHRRVHSGRRDHQGPARAGRPPDRPPARLRRAGGVVPHLQGAPRPRPARPADPTRGRSSLPSTTTSACRTRTSDEPDHPGSGRTGGRTSTRTARTTRQWP